MNIDIKFYLAIFWRRFHYFAVALVAVMALAISIAYKLPPAYVSTARLLLESPQIPNQMAAPTVSTGDLEQLQIIEQRLMTRQNLLEIARKFRVFPGIDTMSPDAIVSAMQSETRIRNQSGRDRATLMTISFTADKSQTAAAVVNEYVTRLLSSSSSMRAGQAQQTLVFFKQEVERLAQNLSNQSARILAFQNANRGALPNTLTYRMTQQSSLQERLASTEREIADLKAQKQRLIALFNATGQVAGAKGLQTPEAKTLASLRNQLSQAQAVLSDTNPKVVLLKSQIARLEEVVRKQAEAAAETTANVAGALTGGAGSGGSGAGTDAPASPQQSMLDIQTAQIDGRLSQLEGRTAAIAKQLAELKSSIDKTADNQITLDSLKRDYDNIQSQYNAAVTRLAQASTGERIEALAKGQRLAVLDPATAPDSPSKPNRRKIILFGLMGGLALGFGLIALRELLDSSLRRPADLTNALGITPIAAIPYLRSPGELARRRTIIATFLLLVAVGVPAGLYAIDSFYMPLDLLAAKVSSRLGI